MLPKHALDLGLNQFTYCTTCPTVATTIAIFVTYSITVQLSYPIYYLTSNDAYPVLV